MPYDTDQFDLLKDRIARILAAFTPHPGSTTRYVDGIGGSDTTGDGTEDSAWQTIAYAESQAAAWDSIIVWGTFTEHITFDLQFMRLVGLGDGLSVLQGTTNDTPLITLNGAHRLEIVGMVIDGSLNTGHGIRIINSNDFYIHNNVIRNITGAYDGIDKSSGGVNTGGRILDNVLRNGAGAGIGVVSLEHCTISRNHCLNNNAEGIILNAACDYNIIEDNVCNDNDEGIEIQGDSNYLKNNTAIGNTTADIVDSGSNNRWEGPQKNIERVIYPVAEDISTTEVSDDGTSPALLAEVSNANANEAAGEATPQWTEDIQIDEEGIAQLISIYFELHWQQKRTGGTTSSAKWQISGDGGTTWVDVTDNVAEAGAVYADKTRIGVSLPITSIAPGEGQLRLRLCAWTDGASVETRVRSDTYFRLTGKKN